MAVLLRSPAAQLALQRLAPASAAAASRLFSNTAAAATASGRNNEELDEINDDARRKKKAKADLIRLRRMYGAVMCRPGGDRIGEAYFASVLRRLSQADGPNLPTTNDDDARIEQAKEELLQLYLRRKPAVGAARVEADLAHLLRRFETRSQRRTSGAAAAAPTYASVVKDDSDWRDSCESMEPEEFSTEPYVGEPDCVSGYGFSGGAYTADSYSGDMFWGEGLAARPGER